MTVQECSYSVSDMLKMQAISAQTLSSPPKAGRTNALLREKLYA
jgi:hypothetical protein